MQPMTWNPALTFRKDSKSSHKIILIKSCHLVYCFYNNIKDQQIFCRCEGAIGGKRVKTGRLGIWGGWEQSKVTTRKKSLSLSLSLSPRFTFFLLLSLLLLFSSHSSTLFTKFPCWGVWSLQSLGGLWIWSVNNPEAVDCATGLTQSCSRKSTSGCLD